VLINNAAVIYNSPLVRFEEGKLVKHDFGKWREVIDVSLSAAFYVSACCAEAMIGNAKKGVIVNISSICAAGNIGQPAYSAAKAGINGLTISLAKELGPLGIRVAAIAPGYLDTESTRGAVAEDYLKDIRKRTPTRRLGEVEQLMQAVDFVIHNSYFNGKVLELDGGLSL
jgi:3-oxoacyl-[acyl-carrier protein] reductase